MIKKKNKVVSDCANQILGYQKYINDNNYKQSKCERSKGVKEGLRKKISSRLAFKKKKRDELVEKEQRFSRTALLITIFSSVPMQALAILLVVVGTPWFLCFAIPIVLYILEVVSISEFLPRKLRKQIKDLNEAIEKDEREFADVNSEVVRLKEVIEKLIEVNKIAEEKIAILKDVVSKLETMVVPEGAQRVVQAQPAKGVQNCDNVQFNSSKAHQLALN